MKKSQVFDVMKGIQPYVGKDENPNIDLKWGTASVKAVLITRTKLQKGIEPIYYALANLRHLYLKKGVTIEELTRGVKGLLDDPEYLSLEESKKLESREWIEDLLKELSFPDWSASWKCSVCRDKNIELIDKLLRDKKVPRGVISKKFNIPYYRLTTHARKCLNLPEVYKRGDGRNTNPYRKKKKEFKQALFQFGLFWKNIENLKNYHTYTSHLTHEEAIEIWAKELREENPDKKYYIIAIPRPDILELDMKSGKITALEYEMRKTTIPSKRRHYEKLGSDFDEVVIRSEDEKYREKFSPPKPNHMNRFG